MFHSRFTSLTQMPQCSGVLSDGGTEAPKRDVLRSWAGLPWGPHISPSCSCRSVLQAPPPTVTCPSSTLSPLCLPRMPLPAGDPAPHHKSSVHLSVRPEHGCVAWSPFTSLLDICFIPRGQGSPCHLPLEPALPTFLSGLRYPKGL